jgi:hypothetical protein
LSSASRGLPGFGHGRSASGSMRASQFFAGRNTTSISSKYAPSLSVTLDTVRAPLTLALYTDAAGTARDQGPSGTPATPHPTRTARDAPCHRRTRPAARPSGEPAPRPAQAHPAKDAPRVLLRVRSLPPPTYGAPSGEPICRTRDANEPRSGICAERSCRPAHAGQSSGQLTAQFRT